MMPSEWVAAYDATVLKKESAEFVTLSTTVIVEGGGYAHFLLRRLLIDAGRQSKRHGAGRADGGGADDARGAMAEGLSLAK